MQRSKSNSKGRPAVAALLFLALICGGQAILPVHGQTKPSARPKPYHLELEAYPAAPFPWFKKFGTINLHVYPGGVSADSFWLSGFSRNGSKDVTIMNPVARMYTDMPLTEMTSMIRKMSSSDNDLANVTTEVQGPMAGKVGSLRASRYRLIYGPAAWIDVWTTKEVPENAQLRAIVDSMIRGVSAPTANAARTIPGMPVYVELNFRRFQKTPFLKLKKLTWNNAGESDALKVGSYYFKAPMVDAIWK
jgi:hypothetical protein